MTKEKKLTTWEVLRYKFPEAEYVLLCEVSDASGFSRSRSLDYMIINLWQSRGLAVTGIEQKTNRSDWLKELKNPQKQENHYKYCDYFCLLTDKDNVAKLEEIPETWGWYHINDSQILKTMKAAPKLNSIPIQRSLLCAMLRRAADKTKYVHVDTLETQIEAKAEIIQQSRNYALERKAKYYDELMEKVDIFEKASGLSIRHSWELPEMGKAVKIIIDGGAKYYRESMERIEKQVKNIHERLVQEISLMPKEQNPERCDTTGDAI